MRKKRGEVARATSPIIRVHLLNSLCLGINEGSHPSPPILARYLLNFEFSSVFSSVVSPDSPVRLGLVQLLGDDLIGQLRIGLAPRLLQHLADEETQHLGFATLILSKFVGVGGDHF
jgi:hypothetical protein